MRPVAFIVPLALVACAEPEECARSADELPSVVLEECDGTERDLAELNEVRGAWLYLYSGS